jgi:MoxR-like ATPase
MFILFNVSQGVGKTSLIANLALLTGHRLVRINLSEHSEIADLLGSDLPSADSSASNPEVCLVRRHFPDRDEARRLGTFG